MRAVFPLLLVSSSFLYAQRDISTEVRLMEQRGDAAGVRAMLQQELTRFPNDPPASLAYAEFLDLHRDPGARAAYERAFKLQPESARAERERIVRRLLILDTLAEDRDAITRHLPMAPTATAAAFNVEAFKRENTAAPASVLIPGPIRSFARMAALSPDLEPGELLPALARNIVTNGYQAASGNEALEQTEYLKLLVRYMSQAREIEKLASKDHMLRIEGCDSPQAGELLRILGYRMRGGCGSDVVLETVNATRAFLTIDSGFPLAELEQDLRTNRPFAYDFQPTSVPVLYGTEYWLSANKEKRPSPEFIDAFLADPSICRLYLGLAKLDGNTAEDLRKGIAVTKLRAFAHVVDFYGSMFQIRNGQAIVPGGPPAAGAWKDLVGAGPEQGVAFFERLITRDDGWMASYFDSIARIGGPVQSYLLENRRLQRFYAAIRGKITSPGPARPVFRANTDMLLLTQRLRLEADGRPHIPGTLEVWKRLFIEHPHGKYDGKLTRLANTWKEPDDLIEALFALSRKSVENEPLKIYMALSDVNRRRSKPLEAATVERLIKEYRTLGSQFSLFAENPALSDKTIVQVLDTSLSAMKIRDQSFRADATGTLQGLIGIWQIFTRQGSIRPEAADAALSAVLAEFQNVRGDRELFETGHKATLALLKAAGVEGASAQDRLVDLLAGTAQVADTGAHRRVVQNMIQVFEAQRLISLDTLFGLADHLENLAGGGKLNPALVSKMAARISEIQLPRASLSTAEKNSLSFGYWTEKHIEEQRKVNLRAAIDKAGSDAEKLREIKGQLAAFLRDTLVGLNYAHYAPPGGQLLQTNPLFVRSHDFLGLQGSNPNWRTTEVLGTGWPANAGGRLVGSLAGLPYALAEAEQNFLIPSREQALIWGDLVPQLIQSAKIPRWWNVTPAQLHWVALHMRQAETLLAESAYDSKLRGQVLELLGGLAPPVRVGRVQNLLEGGKVRDALDSVTPAEMYQIATRWWDGHAESQDVLGAEARSLAKAAAADLTPAAISRAFGTPKPTLANSYSPELLNLRTFPTLMGYSSRIMAESWESNLLYYAALADEFHLQPGELNVVVPEWTQMTVEKIFATHLEDWPALLRSLRLVGEDLRTKAAASNSRPAIGLVQ